MFTTVRSSLRLLRTLAGATVLAGFLAAGSPVQVAAQSRDQPPSFAALVQKELPAVVTITASRAAPPGQRTTTGQEQAPGSSPFPFLPESPMRDFLEDLFKRQMPRGMMPDGQEPPGGAEPGRALGSGFIVDPSGYIVTNNHVVESANKVEVTLRDRRTLDAKVVGTDPQTDLALLKVAADQPLPVVEWGDSDALRVGDWVVAIGNPFGLGGSVTAGILSARARDIGAGPYDDFLQTDAAINSGNSGGPMFDMTGKVIGVNTAIYSQTGGNIGIGFAIPAALAKPIIAELREKGRVTRGYLGVTIQPISPDIATALGLDDRAGALVATVAKDSPAAKAGIRTGDVVVEFAGKRVESPHDLSRMVSLTDPGDTAAVIVRRDGTSITLEARIAELQPPAQQAEAQQVKPGELGMTLAPITPELRRRFDLSNDLTGAVVVQVAPDSPAVRHGFQPGDVITRAGQSPVDDPSDVAAAVEQARKAKRGSVLLLRQRDESATFVPVPVG